MLSYLAFLLPLAWKSHRRRQPSSSPFDITILYEPLAWSDVNSLVQRACNVRLWQPTATYIAHRFLAIELNRYLIFLSLLKANRQIIYKISQWRIVITIFQLLVRLFTPLLLPVSLAYTNSNIAILLLQQIIASLSIYPLLHRDSGRLGGLLYTSDISLWWGVYRLEAEFRD